MSSSNGRQQQGQFPGSIWIPHAHFWAGRGRHHIRYVIIHGTAWPGGNPSAADIARYFQTTKRETGTHYIVGKDGAVVQCVREEDSAWGNGILSSGHDAWWGGSRGNPNLETVSIEHVKNHGDNSDSVTDAQAEASYRLIDYLCGKWGIPRRWADAEGGITGHYSIDPINRRFCPGPYPWDELFHRINAPADAPLPTIYSPLSAQVAAETQTSGLPQLGGPDGAARGAGTRAHEFLSEFPGWFGIVEAVDASEQFNAVPVRSPADVGSWLGANLFALFVRLLLIVLGVGLIVGLLFALARGNSWLGEAGGDAVPFALPS